MVIKKIIVGNLNTNCYIIENDNECLIIDPGSDFDLIKKSVIKQVVGILITHKHFDHVGALNDCVKYYNANVFDKKNLNEGDNTINSFKFEVMYNPGHTLDSVSFVFDNNLFSGDFIFEGFIGRCDLGGNFALMKKSINNILSKNINFVIYPGHGNSTSLFKEKNNLKSYLN